MSHLNISPSIHILDCTFITVSLKKNNNYKESGIVKRDGEVYRGYKLASIRGILEDTGILEEIKLEPIQKHDLENPNFYSSNIMNYWIILKRRDTRKVIS